ncbi:predicted protein [Phaeodactylum tricornutum CCAP 1055/1]|uniref:RNA helicase n=1 Tax=Phaeodactylum tricornutum (strain CCAP 1055/1) TaxID=556484 RepID=B7FZA2_PHATC|nr:predicted protein [Phaeodactylum tricornutum CCAP 1055/1]EEC48306.1 predicted protein [Phaeodactylum tricornutum CCAP 1055/1]|eukprot:XP_002180115.1 predicted protein [Phaeodactylum tricornutum CCAP 1055/1]
MKLFSETAKKKRHRSDSIDSLANFRQNLPVYAYRTELLRAIRSPKIVLVTASTGSGKSTQIPAYLIDSEHVMAVTQPRRVAATTLAQRVAHEHQGIVGHQIGYRVRFDDCTRSDTQLTYVTDGMLLREAMVDPLLRKYSIIFLDEAHERSLQTDILLGVVQRARKSRQQSYSRRPLQIVVMSATLQVQTFEDFFGKENVVRIEIPGRQFPVQMLYTSVPAEDYMEATLATILQIHTHEEAGDVLVFLPGQEEIEDLATLLRGNTVSQLLANGVLICLLYAALPPEAQLAAFAEKPEGCRRKIILATNIAETSVTLPAIRYVVDTGKHKLRQILATGMDSLTVESVSQAQAAQRAGRAGRIGPGLCFRLYTEDAFERLDPDSLPEILRVGLAQVILQLKGMGVQDPTTFDFVTPPDTSSLVRAAKLLYALGAVNDAMELTDYGKKLAKLPLDPVFGHLLLKSAEYSCTSEMLTAVAVLSAENVFYRPTTGEVIAKAAAAHRRFASHEGDLPTFLNVYQAWEREASYHSRVLHGEWCQRNFVSGRSLGRAYHVRQQLRSTCLRPAEKNGLGMDVNVTCGKDRESFLKCAAAGLFLQVASRTKAETEIDSRGNETVSIHPTSTMFGRHPAPACVVFTELVTTKKTYIRGVTQIREEWLHEVAPVFYPK